MARREQNRRDYKRNGQDGYPAKNKYCRRNNRQCKSAKQAVLFKKNRPNHTIHGSQPKQSDNVNGKRSVKPPTGIRIRNIENHKAEATESTDLLYYFNILGAWFICKPVFVFNGKQNVRYHNKQDCRKPVNIKPTHKAVSLNIPTESPARCIFYPLIKEIHLFLRMKPMFAVLHYGKRRARLFRKIGYRSDSLQIILFAV